MKKDMSDSAEKNNDSSLNNGFKKQIGKVTVEEKEDIKLLFERKNGLTELFKTFAVMSKNEIENNALYDRVVRDTGEVTVKLQNWWDNMSRKYKWENLPGYKWEIDFESCLIYLVKM